MSSAKSGSEEYLIQSQRRALATAVVRCKYDVIDPCRELSCLLSLPSFFPPNMDGLMKLRDAPKVYVSRADKRNTYTRKARAATLHGHKQTELAYLAGSRNFKRTTCSRI